MSFTYRTIKNISLILSGLVFLPSLASANVVISAINVSNSSPVPGLVIGVTVTYCESANTTPYFLVALNPNSTTLQACPAASQVFMVDTGTSPTGVSPVSGNQADSSPSGNGWAGIAVPNTPPACPYIQIFNVTIPFSTGPGPINLIVAAGDNYVQCGGGIVSTMSTVLTLPLPPPGVTLNKRAEAVTTAPGSLVLFTMDYSFINTTGVTITDSVPPNTTVYQMGPLGTQTGSALTWIVYNGVATTQKIGTVWFLAQVNPSAPDGTIINNSATITAAGAPTSISTASTSVAVPHLTLTKSQSAPSLPNGGSVTYTLAWSADGQSLQVFDTYNNDANGTTNGSILGYDNTGYTYTNLGGGGFTVLTDAFGNNYIQGCANNVCNSGVTTPNYPSLLRNGPSLSLCNSFTVEGDMQIPLGSASGADSTMVIADNLAAPGVNDAYMVGMSLDCGPGNFFVQKNQSPGTVSFPAALCNNSIGTTITAGVWYTVKAYVTYSGGLLTIQAKIWPKGAAEPAASSINWTDPTPLPCVPINGGTYKTGWQADGSSSTDYFANLKIFGPGPVVSSAVTDLLPTGVTFGGFGTVDSGTVTAFSAGTLSWSNPATLFGQPVPLTWWGTVACPGPISNQFTMAASGIPFATSNTVNLTLSSCSTPSPTLTNTPSPTATNSPTPTPANSPTSSPTPTLTNTLTPTATNTPTLTPSITYTPTNTFTPTITPTPTATPAGLHVWPIPFDPKYAVGGVLKAYQCPTGSTMSFYTVSAELVKTAGETGGWITWDGHNNNGAMVSTGTYYYVIQNKGSTLLTGKVLVLIDR